MVVHVLFKKGADTMGATVRAKVSRGVLKPLETLDLPEGSEVTVTIESEPTRADIEAFRRAAGSWKDLDAKKFMRDVRRSRRISTRPVPKL